MSHLLFVSQATKLDASLENNIYLPFGVMADEPSALEEAIPLPKFQLLSTLTFVVVHATKSLTNTSCVPFVSHGKRFDA
jgi:hypothetical protein